MRFFPLLLLSCVASTPLHPDRVIFDGEPIVGVAEASLMDSAEWAVEQWSWGVLQAGCDGADICLERGALSVGGSAGKALWYAQSGTCTARVNNPRNQDYVVAHELGHCYGLAHNEDQPNSIMFPRLDPNGPHFVTDRDLEALDRIRYE